jgi:hypothetical protein
MHGLCQPYRWLLDLPLRSLRPSALAMKGEAHKKGYLSDIIMGLGVCLPL